MIDTRDIEADLVGLAIVEPSITNLKVEPAEFQAPDLGAIWGAIRSLHAEGVQPDPIGIVQRAKPFRVEHSTVVDLVGRMGVGANAPHYADQITARHQREQLGNALTYAQNRLLDPDAATDQVISELLDSVDTAAKTEDIAERTMTLDEFCSQPLPPNEWVVDDLISRGDRLVLTGSEGAGKSILMRQIAVCAAAGLHPFDEQRVKPRRVLVIDAENPLRIMVNTYGRLRGEVNSRGLPTEDRLWIHRFPQGLNLDKSQDRLKLHTLCRNYRPDLLVIGPAYKLYVGGANAREEDLARLVTSALDGLREEFGFALILEHHSPHAAPGVEQRSVRPIGSSLWMRWPEFGIGLRLEKNDGRPGYRSAEVVHWRGPRDERPWPQRLESSSRLPWVEGRPR